MGQKGRGWMKVFTASLAASLSLLALPSISAAESVDESGDQVAEASVVQGSFTAVCDPCQRQTGGPIASSPFGTGQLALKIVSFTPTATGGHVVADFTMTFSEGTVTGRMEADTSPPPEGPGSTTTGTWEATGGTCNVTGSGTHSKTPPPGMGNTASRWTWSGYVSGYENSPCLPELQLGKAKRNKKRGTATLSVPVPGAGALELLGSKVKGKDVRADAAGEEKLVVKPRGKTASKLRKTGKATVRATVLFISDAGEAFRGTKKIRLVKGGGGGAAKSAASRPLLASAASNESAKGGARASQAGGFTVVCDPCNRQTGGPITESPWGSGKLDFSVTGFEDGPDVNIATADFTMTFDRGTVTGTARFEIPKTQSSAETVTVKGTWNATGGTCKVTGEGTHEKAPDSQASPTSKWTWTGNVSGLDSSPCKGGSAEGSGSKGNAGSAGGGSGGATGGSGDDSGGGGELAMTGVSVVGLTLLGSLILLSGLLIEPVARKARRLTAGKADAGSAT